MTAVRTVAITGTTGYLGGALSEFVRGAGLEVVALNRHPHDATPSERFVPFSLGEPIAARAFDGVDALVHAAWNLSSDDEAAVNAQNVDGSVALFDAAIAAGVSRLLFVSSMSAYVGTRQVYGSMKLAVEAETLRRNGVVARPGLIYGPQAHGMARTLATVAKLPVWPSFGRGGLYTVHQDDLVNVLTTLVEQFELTAGNVIGVAHPRAVSLQQVLAAFGGRMRPTVPVPPSLVIGTATLAGRIGVRLPFRPDALLGLIDQPPPPLGADLLDRLQLTLRPFDSEVPTTGS